MQMKTTLGQQRADGCGMFCSLSSTDILIELTVRQDWARAPYCFRWLSLDLMAQLFIKFRAWHDKLSGLKGLLGTCHIVVSCHISALKFSKLTLYLWLAFNFIFATTALKLQSGVVQVMGGPVEDVGCPTIDIATHTSTGPAREWRIVVSIMTSQGGRHVDRKHIRVWKLFERTVMDRWQRSWNGERLNLSSKKSYFKLPILNLFRCIFLVCAILGTGTFRGCLIKRCLCK